MERYIKDFLTRHSMNYADVKEQIGLYIKKAQAGLETGEGPFAMVPTYVKSEGEIPVGEPVIVVDAGGTNLRVALVRFNEKLECVTEKIEKHSMLGIDKEITIEEFFDTVAEYLKDFLPYSKNIGFVFSFPCNTLPNLDGEIVKFDKEIKISGAEGHHISEDLNKSIRKLGFEGQWNVIVLNDTTTTLMGGVGIAKQNDCKSIIGVIFGTGMNIAYVQKNKDIKKVPELAVRDDSMAVNMEAGFYDGFPKSDFDKAVQERSKDPGENQFEKMVSGAYQGPVVTEMLKVAADEKLFSDETNEKIKNMAVLKSSEVDDYVRDVNGDNTLANAVASQDKQTVYDMVEFYYDRTAQLLSISLVGTMLLHGEGKPIDYPICIVVDGSTFYKTLLFRPMVDRYTKEIAGEYNQKYMFTKIEDGNISGAAASVLMNI